MGEKKMLEVETPVGKIRVEAKGAKDEYPGVWVSLVGEDGSDSLFAMAEYDTAKGLLQVATYADLESDVPTEITEFGWAEGLAERKDAGRETVRDAHMP